MFIWKCPGLVGI